MKQKNILIKNRRKKSVRTLCAPFPVEKLKLIKTVDNLHLFIYPFKNIEDPFGLFIGNVLSLKGKKPQDHVIIINEYAGKEKEEVLWHEMFHAFLYLFSKPNTVSCKNEEYLCDRFFKIIPFIRGLDNVKL